MGFVVDAVGGLVGDLLGGAPAAPDYSPVANASIESQRLANELGREQLAESKRQYDSSKEVADKVVNAQLGLMDQTKRQGDDYYDYSKQFRPLEQQLVKDASMGGESANAAERNRLEQLGLSQADQIRKDSSQFQQQAGQRSNDLQNMLASQGLRIERDADAFGRDQQQDIALATGGNRAIYDRYQQDIDNDVSRAVADARLGQTQALNTAARQAIRYGLSTPSNMDQLTATNAASLAAAANNSRVASTDQMRGLVGQSVGMNQSNFNNTLNARMAGMGMQTQGVSSGLENLRANYATDQAAKADVYGRQMQASSNARNMRLQDQSLDFARRLDVAGIARGLPGASQGAYGLSINAGNSAAQNQAAPGNAYLNNMQSGIGTIQRGQQIGLQGQLGVLNNQVQGDIAFRNQKAEVVGAAIGAGGRLAATPSDIRLKQDIVSVGVHADTGLNMYEFAYTDQPDRRFVGVMAQEVLPKYPHAVVLRTDGYMMVDYEALGLEMREVH